VETRLPARVGAGSLYDGWSPRQRPGGGATPEVLRFHLLTDEVAAAAWHGIGGGAGGGTAGHRSAAGGEGEADAAADMFPLVLSPREQQLVTRCLRDDLLVLGRGGTGKTTVTVHAMAAAAAEDTDARVLFLTVNSHLCTSVWRQVTSLRRGGELARGSAAVAAMAAIRAAALPAVGGGGAASGSGEEDGAGPPAPAAVCNAEGKAWWPLCMPSRAWLLALDASLVKPFLLREQPPPAAAAAGASPRIADADAAFAAAILGTGGANALVAAAAAADDDHPPGAGRKAAVGGSSGVRVFAGFDFWKGVYDKHFVGRCSLNLVEPFFEMNCFWA